MGVLRSQEKVAGAGLLTIPRIYLPRQLEMGSLIELADDDFRYIKNVLRLKPGESITLFGFEGHEYHARIEEIAARAVSARIDGVERIPEPDIRIVLAQSLPKGDKMDLITQKATELGVSVIIPFHSSRSIPKLVEGKAKERVRRWRKIALEACRQSGRADIPEISEIVSFEEMLLKAGDKGLKLIFWEAESGLGIKQVLRAPENEAQKHYLIVVGPEGGFSAEEVQKATAAGMISVSLGRQVLKVETASLAILSIIQYEKGLIGTAAE